MLIQMTADRFGASGTLYTKGTQYDLAADLAFRFIGDGVAFDVGTARESQEGGQLVPVRYNTVTGVMEANGAPVSGAWVSQAASSLPSTFPFGIPPSGTVAANGALTLGTALNAVYGQGIFFYFPAGAAFSGSIAGMYYCVMSSTTVGTIYANTMSGVPRPPSTPTPIVDAGPGAYTSPTGSNLTLATVLTISPGELGARGGWRGRIISSNNNTASGKTLRFFSGAQSVGGATTSTSANNAQDVTFQNVGSQASNVVFFQNFGASAIGQARSVSTVDTSVEQVISIGGQLVVATDWVIVDTVELEKLGNV